LLLDNLAAWRCDICLEFSSTSHFFSLEAHAEESMQKKETAEKVYFYLRHNF
jgi:hypothetical protein